MKALWTQLRFAWRRCRLLLAWVAIGVLVLALYAVRQRQLAQKLILKQRQAEARFEIDKLNHEWICRKVDLSRSEQLRFQMKERRKRLAREYEAMKLEIEGKSRDEIVSRLRDLDV